MLDVEINIHETNAGEDSDAPDHDNSGLNDGTGHSVDGRLPYRRARAVAAPALYAAVAHARLTGDSSSASEDEGSESDTTGDDGSSSSGEDISGSSSSGEDEESDDDEMDVINNNLPRSLSGQMAIPVAYLVADEMDLDRMQDRIANLAGPTHQRLYGLNMDDDIPVIKPMSTPSQEETQTKSFKQFDTYNTSIKILENVCRSRELSIEKLMECIDALPPNPGLQLNKSPMLHYALRNDRVTFDVVECIMGYNPAASHICMGMDAASIFPLQYPLHVACANPSCDSSILELLLSANPGALFHDACSRRLPLSFYLLRSRNVNFDMVRQLIEKYPKALTEVDNYRGTPAIRTSTTCSRYNEERALGILRRLMRIYPESIRHVDHDGCIPLHKAAGCESPAFCKILVDAHPKSVATQRRQLGGGLPIHRACFMGRLSTVKFLYEQYPESIFTHAERSGYLPIHKAVQGHLGRDQIEIVKFLLTVDQDAAKREVVALDSTRSRDHGLLSLHLLCHLDRSLDVAKVLFDAYPQAVYVKGRNDRTPLAIEPSKSGIARYLKGQMNHVSELRKSPELDGLGRSTVHRALMQGASLGAIKLLVQDDPSALGVVDDMGVDTAPLRVRAGHGRQDPVPA
ncbi:hypothetical protein THAOC_37492 [Thalassiosira oceanica]|uniref:Uncharacterized protein n=1 Tax=Thalassiosira oceanica TaxID=159749 RepID=K0QYC1_THAOC|nr:hypothetical protein THAOC_37492 [Thalassiosira oceanica]|eukprot:EJK44008.1 hypothetical protein THAOC_37492 [Thalassiosira oceanica]